MKLYIRDMPCLPVQLAFLAIFIFQQLTLLLHPGKMRYPD